MLCVFCKHGANVRGAATNPPIVIPCPQTNLISQALNQVYMGGSKIYEELLSEVLLLSSHSFHSSTLVLHPDTGQSQVPFAPSPFPAGMGTREAMPYCCQDGA